MQFPLWLPPGVDPDRIQNIERVPYDRLTFQQVYQDFRERDRPLLITDVPQEESPCFGNHLRDPMRSQRYDNKTGDPFVLALMDHCRGTVRVTRMTDDLDKRKGHTFLDSLSFKKFLDLWRRNAFKDEMDNPYYKQPIQGAVDEDIRTMCPHLWQHLRFPAYFSGEMLLHSKETGEHYSEDGTYPQFYFSTKGIPMYMHIDVPKTELWSAICTGKKWYWVSPASEAWKIYSGPGEHLHDALRNPWGHAPLPAWRGVAQPGDIIYIPAGAFHSILAEEDTINIVNNFIDVGELAAPSQTNIELLKTPPTHLGIVNWLEDETRRVQVYDAEGIVNDPRQTARGFPTWRSLISKIQAAHQRSTQPRPNAASESASTMRWRHGKHWDGIPRASMRSSIGDFLLLEETEGVVNKVKSIYADFGLELVSKIDLDAVKIKDWETGGGIGINDVELFVVLGSLFRIGLVDFKFNFDIFGIGNAFGYSALVMAVIFPGARIDFIDAGIAGPDNGRGTAITNQIAKAKGFDIHVYTGFSPQDAHAAQRSESYDLSFIDGKHKTSAIQADFDVVLPLMKWRSVIVLHDVGTGLRHEFGKFGKFLEAFLPKLLRDHGYSHVQYNGTNFVTRSCLVLHRGFDADFSERLVIQSLGQPGTILPGFDTMYHCNFKLDCVQRYWVRREQRSSRLRTT